jgi:hypothetical protein
MKARRAVTLRSLRSSPLAGRPADRGAIIVVPDALARSAAIRGISTTLAVTVAVEYGLAVDDLEAGGVTEAEELLAQAAAATTVSHAVCIRHGDYLQVLSHALNTRRGDVRDSSADALVPTRLAMRARAVAVDAAMLDAALACELASVLEGRTLSEWALAVALRQRVARTNASARYKPAAARQSPPAISAVR